jgi:hypothetical protein
MCTRLLAFYQTLTVILEDKLSAFCAFTYSVVNGDCPVFTSAFRYDGRHQACLLLAV